MTPFYDAHTHLGGLDPAAARGIVCAVKPADWPAIKALAAADHRVTPAYGVHPWYAAEARGNWLEELESYLAAGPCCAGETGLDAARPAEGQRKVFVKQLELAKKYSRPPIIHCVRAWGEMLEIIRAVRPGRFLLHAYGGSPELVKDFIALGAYFSFGRDLQNPARKKLQSAHQAVPIARRLYESDNYGDMILNYFDSVAIEDNYLKFIGENL